MKWSVKQKNHKIGQNYVVVVFYSGENPESAFCGLDNHMLSFYQQLTNISVSVLTKLN